MREVPALRPSSVLSMYAGLIAVLVRLLWPKMRKRSGRLGGKGAPGSARAAILNFFTALEPAELRPLLALFLAPIGPAIRSEQRLAQSSKQPFAFPANAVL